MMCKYEEKAIGIFEQGNNCAQSVFAAFAEDYGLDEKQALLVASSFGGGMGGMKETCGALTGAFMAAGLKYGYGQIQPEQDVSEIKSAHNKRIQAIAEDFRKSCGALTCRDLLALIEADAKWSEMKKPCSVIVRNACRIMKDMEEQNI